MLVLFILCIEVMFYIDFAEKLDSVRRLNGYGMQSAGDIGDAHGEENVRLYAVNVGSLSYLFFL